MINLKKLYIIPFIILILLCGCKENNKTEKVKSLSFVCEIEKGDKTYKIDSKIDKSGEFSGTVVYPETIKGMELVANKDTATFSFMGVKYEADTKKYPVSAFTNIIFSAVNDNESAQKSEIKGKIENYEYILSFDENNLPKELTIEKLKLKIYFKDIKINGE